VQVVHNVSEVVHNASIVGYDQQADDNDTYKQRESKEQPAPPVAASDRRSGMSANLSHWYPEA
jgi:hypothetical protein